MGLFDNLFGLGKKKTEEPTAGFRLELLGDTRDKKLTEYQRKGLEILTSMEAERELMRRCGEPIERRFYGVCVHTRRADREYGFESPMEGIELLRHFAGQDVQWFRLREDEGPERFKPFKGEPAEYRIIETGKARPAPLPDFPVLARDNLPREARLAALVDVETTGLIPGADGIVEFAGILFAFDGETGRVLGQVDEYSSYHDPGVPISPEAAAKNNITQSMIQGHQLDTQRVDSQLSEAEFIVAHNAWFGREFLGRVSHVAESKPWRCSMKEIDWSKYSSAALWSLLYFHGISRPRTHRAIDDARCTLQLLDKADALANPYLRQLINRR